MGKMTVSIKNVDEDAWKTFKAEAVKHDMTMSEFLEELLEEHRKREADSNWEEIFSYAGSITGEEAEEMKEKARDIREAFELRDHDTSA